MLAAFALLCAVARGGQVLQGTLGEAPGDASRGVVGTTLSGTFPKKRKRVFSGDVVTRCSTSRACAVRIRHSFFAASDDGQLRIQDAAEALGSLENVRDELLYRLGTLTGVGADQADLAKEKVLVDIE